MKVLVTGARGMIGRETVKALAAQGNRVIAVDRTGENGDAGAVSWVRLDLEDEAALRALVERTDPDRIIHLAALAHTAGEGDLSWERYRRVNVDCARHVFDAAGDRPVLLISTVDVYGFLDGAPVLPDTTPRPVSKYAKSKLLAEQACRRLPRYDIFRLSPVYSRDIRRDIQKRYYLKYPTVAYRVGKGVAWEVLSLEKAADTICRWCGEEPQNAVRIVKDDQPLRSLDAIAEERRGSPWFFPGCLC